MKNRASKCDPAIAAAAAPRVRVDPAARREAVQRALPGVPQTKRYNYDNYMAPLTTRPRTPARFSSRPNQPSPDVSRLKLRPTPAPAPPSPPLFVPRLASRVIDNFLFNCFLAC